MSEQSDQQELLNLLARQEVAALVDRYVATLDDPSVTLDEAWARALFTEDVRVEHAAGVLTGLEQAATAHHFVTSRWDRTLHFSTNHHVELGGGRAHLTARLMAIHIHPGENPPDPLIAANLLDADAARTNDGWRIARLAIQTVWRCGTPAQTAAGQS